jgi:hypothetical protein
MKLDLDFKSNKKISIKYKKSKKLKNKKLLKTPKILINHYPKKSINLNTNLYPTRKIAANRISVKRE